MRAVVCCRLGDPTSPMGENTSSSPLAIKDYPSPTILADHVRIRVAAASLNFPDALQIQVGPAACPCKDSPECHAVMH